MENYFTCPLAIAKTPRESEILRGEHWRVMTTFSFVFCSVEGYQLSVSVPSGYLFRFNALLPFVRPSVSGHSEHLQLAVLLEYLLERKQLEVGYDLIAIDKSDALAIFDQAVTTSKLSWKLKLFLKLNAFLIKWLPCVFPKTDFTLKQSLEY